MVVEEEVNIVGVVDVAARRLPDAPMIESRGCVWSYEEAVAASHREAFRLADLGVGQGDRVAILAHNIPEFIIAMMAVWRVGAVLVPINHKLSGREWSYILTHCSAKILYASSLLAPAVKEFFPGTTIALETIERAEPGAQWSLFPTVVVADDEPAQILYTSGTTGSPKGCVHSHGTMRSTAMLSAISFSMTPADRMLIAMPIWHAAPLNNFTMSTLFVGGTIVMLPEYEPEAFIQSLQHDRISVYFGAPVSFSLPLARPGGLAECDFSSIRALIYGGGPISADLSKRLAEAYQTDRFYQVYGMTETGPTGTMLYPEEQQEKAGSIGRWAQPGVDLRIVDQDGADVAAGGVGEVWLKSPALMHGYLGNGQATREVIEDGWYKTGDLVRVDADGYMFIVDRLKDMIITGGENVYSKEVEDALMTIDGVADCAVIGLPHEEWGETVVAAIVPASGTVPTIETIRAAMHGHLAPYKMPRQLCTIETLPRTPTGKVMKHQLRGVFHANSAPSG